MKSIKNTFIKDSELKCILNIILETCVDWTVSDVFVTNDYRYENNRDANEPNRSVIIC